MIQRLSVLSRGLRAGQSRGTAVVSAVAAIALAAVTVLSLVGAGSPAARADLARGTLWLANLANGTVSHVNGFSGRRDAQVRVSQGQAFTVVQRADGAYIVDDATGAVSRLDGATSRTTAPVTVLGTGVRLATGGGHTWEVLPSTGQAVEVDPLTLQPLGDTVPLGGEVDGVPVVDGNGHLWVRVKDTTSVTRAAPGGSLTTVEVGRGGDAIGLAVAGGTPVAYNATAGTVTDLITDWQVPVPAGGRSAVAGGDEAGDTVIVVGAESATGVELGTGVIGSVPVEGAGSVSKAVVAGRDGYLLDPSTRSVRVVQFDLGTSSSVEFTPADDVSSRDGLVFVNDLSGANAAVVDRSGRTVKVEKYTEASTQAALAGDDPVARELPARTQAPDTQPAQQPSAPAAQLAVPQATQPPVVIAPQPTVTLPPSQPTESPAPQPAPSPSDPPAPASPSVTPTPEPPAVVQDLSGTAGDAQATLTWQPGGGEAHGYQVSVEPAVEGYPRTVTTPGETVAGLANGTQYTFTVAAQDALGLTGPAASVTATPRAPGAPSEVRELWVGAGEGTDRLEAGWQPPADNGGADLLRYHVLVLTPQGVTAKSFDLAPDSVSSTITGLKGGTSYRVSVQPVNQYGAGTVVERAASTNNGPPVIESFGVSGGTETSLTWQAVVWQLGLDTTCVVKVDGAQKGGRFACGDGEVGPRTITGLAAAEDHTLQLVATNAKGSSTAAAVGHTSPPTVLVTAQINPANPAASAIFANDRSGARLGTIGQGERPVLTCQVTGWPYAGSGDWYRIAAGSSYPAGLVLREEFTEQPSVPECATRD